ncbi:LAETG motif-containing sortase-dependent surface protein [Streptomyces sp. NPDC020192]|uniref:LAETG motif-containing sortase-dependent surface protein n=1 Tax=Streptomyces sp. NPDC020192 TaxID=3365066 RepID=UPI0037B0AE3D
MFRSRRLTRAARVIGTSAAAAALSVAAAQTALACDISDFSAAPACDSSGKPVVRVTDKDASGTPATVTLKIELSMPGGERDIETKTIEHPTAEGVSVDLHPLSWYAGQTFVIHVKAGDSVDEDLKPPVVVPDDFTCAPSGSGGSSSSASPVPSAPASSAAPSPTHSSSAAPTPTVSSAPSPAGGGTNLAETGASSNTPVIAGAAAALVVVGGGLVLALRRRTAHRSR